MMAMDLGTLSETLNYISEHQGSFDHPYTHNILSFFISLSEA